VRDGNISDYVALYVVGDFRWMEREAKREDVERGHKSYLSIKQAYSTFSKHVSELPKGDISCGFWLLDTKDKGVDAILPSLRQHLMEADDYGFNSSEVEIIRGPYVSIFGTNEA
jgi:hypothetical protein